MEFSGFVECLTQTLLRFTVLLPVTVLERLIGFLHGVTSVLKCFLKIWFARRLTLLFARVGTTLLTFAGFTRRVRVTSTRTGVSPEYLVKRFVKSRRESNLLTERHQHTLEHWVRSFASRTHIHRLDVQQTTSNRQGQQVTVLHLRLTLAQKVQTRLNIGLSVEVVLCLTRTRERRVARKLKQTQLSIVVVLNTLLITRVRIGSQEPSQVVTRLALSGSRNKGRRQ